MVFALIVTLLLIALWPIIKEVGLVVSVLISSGGPPPGAQLGQQLWRELTWPFRWRTYCGWEAWSVARWWLLFGALAMALPSNLPREQRFRRLMLFAPWIALLEIGYLVGVWFVRPTIVPEPNTLFATWPISVTEVLTNSYWLARGALPTLAVGLVFARAVLTWPWPASATLAMILVPTALLFSALWTWLFMASGLLGYLYGW
jgi:hypothetical protein